MIYGDNPQKINEREDALGLKTYTYVPQITAIVQAGNLYVYCGNTPTTYVDPTGKFGIIGTLLIGGGVGAIVSSGIQVLRNISNGEKWTNGIGKALLSGAISGAISVISIPGINAWVAVATTGTDGNIVGQLIAGEVHSANDVASALIAGAAAGIIGKGAADLFSKGFQSYFSTLTKARQKELLSNIGKITNRELTAIRKEINSGLTSKKLQALVERYGYDVIVSAFVSSTTATATS